MITVSKKEKNLAKAKEKRVFPSTIRGYHFLDGEVPPRIAAFCCSNSRSRGLGPGPLHRDAGPNGCCMGRCSFGFTKLVTGKLG